MLKKKKGASMCGWELKVVIYLIIARVVFRFAAAEGFHSKARPSASFCYVIHYFILETSGIVLI